MTLERQRFKNNSDKLIWNLNFWKSFNKPTTTTTTTVLRPFARDYSGEPVPEETLTHPPSWSSSNLYQHLPSTTIHSILPCSNYVLGNLFVQPLSMFSLVCLLVWSPPPHIPYISSMSSFRSTCPYHRSLFCCSINIISSIPSLSLNSLHGTLSFTSLVAAIVLCSLCQCCLFY